MKQPYKNNKWEAGASGVAEKDAGRPLWHRICRRSKNRKDEIILPEKIPRNFKSHY